MIFKSYWGTALVIMALVAVLLRHGLSIMLLGLVALTVGLALLWSRSAVRRLSCTRTLSAARALPGDEVTLSFRLANRKLLGLPSVTIDETVPARLDFGSRVLLPHNQINSKVLRRVTSLRAYEAISWSVSFRCPQRGLYSFGPTHITTTDAFGLTVRELELPERLRLLVYPELARLPDIRLRARHPVGDIRSQRQLLTDPSRTVGVRDYRRDDPLKAVHWGATARRGELQTRIFEPTTSLDIAIMLNLDTFEHYWEGVRYDQIEYMISVAAAVATEAARQKLGFGLYTNGATADEGQMVRIAPDRSPAQLPIVLEVLAKLVAHSVAPFPAVLRRLSSSLSHGATVVIISAVVSEALETALLRLKQRRGRVVLLYAGDGPAPAIPGIEVVPLRAGQIWGAQPGQISVGA